MNVAGRLFLVTATVLAAQAIAVPAQSASLRPVNLPQMVGLADRIVVGRAVGETTGRDDRGLPSTITTFVVTRVLKGEPIESLRVKQLGVTEVQPDGLAAWVDGMPRYRRGAEYLLFLNPDSVWGFTSPVGAFQGAFEVRSAGGGRRAVVNGVGNRNLLAGLDAPGRERLGLSPEAFPFVGRGRGPVDLEELTGMVQRLLGNGGQGVTR